MMFRILGITSFVTLATGCVVGDATDDGDGFGVDSFAAKKVTIVQHNVEKTGGPIDNAVANVKALGGDGITLEEVCPTQLADLHKAHDSEWTIKETLQKHVPNTGCDGAVPYTVAIWTGGTNGTFDGEFRALGTPAEAPGVMVCVGFTSHKVPAHLCALHLISSKFVDANGVTHPGDDVRRTQIADVLTHTHPWTAKGDFVLLGGDFNGEPDTAPLDLMYPKALNGSGDFTEYNRSGSSRDGQDTAHSDGSNTDDGLPYSKKIDYVFFSRNHAPLDGPAVDIHKDASDHDMLTSSAMMQK